MGPPITGAQLGRIPSEPRKPRSTASCGHRTIRPEQLSSLSHDRGRGPPTHLQGAARTDLRNGGSSLGPPASGWRRSREHDKSGVWRTRATPCTARSFPGDPSKRPCACACAPDPLQNAADGLGPHCHCVPLNARSPEPTLAQRTWEQDADRRRLPAPSPSSLPRIRSVPISLQHPTTLSSPIYEVYTPARRWSGWLAAGARAAPVQGPRGSRSRSESRGPSPNADEGIYTDSPQTPD